MVATIIIISILVYFIYKYIVTLSYWKKQGISCVTPWPIVGNMGANFFGKRSLAHILQDLYDAFPNKRYVGIYNATSRELLIRDLDMLKKLTIKEFDSFPEHRQFIPEGIDPLWSNNLFAMKGGAKWQHMRSSLSPAFTTSKLKHMFVIMKECTINFSSHFLKEGGTVSLEVKEAFGRYANDVIASAVFGVSSDSLREPNNDFYQQGLSLTQIESRQLKFFAYIIAPSFFKMLKMKILASQAGIFFANVIRETVKLRKEKSIVRKDMVHLLMKAGENPVAKDSKMPKFSLSNDVVTAQAIIFHFAGLDTTSTMLSHTLFELALNPDIQARLREEVDETLKKCNGDITYESLFEMKYLDMVLSESLRKWPPFVVIDRVATKSITIEPEYPDEKPLYIKPGLICVIPIYALHRDAKYFPNPNLFDPERFSDENKHKIEPFSYIPFGAGPRNCIGARYALLKGKLMLVEILSKFEVEPTKKTKIPLELSKWNFTCVPDGGFWLGLKPRQTT